MDITCPQCATRYAADIPVLPAKVRCTTCGVKCLVDEAGGISVMADRPTITGRQGRMTAKPAKRSTGGNPAMTSALVVMALAGITFFFLRDGGKPGIAVETPESIPVVPPLVVEKSPQVVEAPAAPPVVAKPQPPAAAVPPPLVVGGSEETIPGQPDEEIVPEDPRKPASIPEADPEIARVLAAVDARISANPATAEAEVRNFIRAFYTPRNGATIGGRLTETHPDLALSLLGDLWKRIEDSPGAKLPVSPPLLIGTMRSRAQDMTESYTGLLGKAAEKGPVDDEGIRKLSQDPQIAKLLGHFAKGQDSGTADNALTLGRMIHDIRLGKAPLADAGPEQEPRSIDDLPKVARSVDLGGFESVQDLVKWAHGIMLSNEKTMSISEGEEAAQMRQRAKAYINLPREVLLPHPSAEDFPGKVSAKAPRVEKEVAIDTAVANWHPTGLYAAPGEVITVRVPASLRGKGYQMVIGTNSDDLTGGQYEDGRKTLKRFPLIIQRTPLDESRVEVGNPFGGPIFIDAPYRGGDDIVRVPAHGETVRCYPKAPAPDWQKVTIGGAVEMPWWRPGMTTDEWRKQLTNPAPWVELDFGMLRMSVPTEDAKGIRDIAKLTEFWKVVMDAQWTFGGFPGVRVIPMR
ncbi:MAG: hypothetical protein EOP87_11260, partial [Verrucomicrobiaceae bacterium]